MSLIIGILFLIVYFIKNNNFVYLATISILITNFFNLVEANTEVFGFSIRNQDVALVIIIIIFIKNLIRNNLFNRIELKNVKASIFLFFIAFTIISFLNIRTEDNTISQIFIFGRKYAFLLFYFTLADLKLIEYKHFWNFLYLVTFIYTVLFIGQYFFYYQIGPYSYMKFYDGYVRTVNWLPFVFIYYFYFINSRYSFNHIAFIIVSSFSFLITLSRGLLISIIISTLLSLYLQNKTKVVAVSIIIFIIISLPISQFSILSNRLDQGLEQLSNLSNFNYKTDYKFGNVSFRMAHFVERFYFVSQKPKRLLFGFTFTPENDFNQNLFIIGTYNQNWDKTVQLDTPDISWSNFIIRFGLIGTIIYFFLFWCVSKYFYKNRKIVDAKVGFIYLMFAFLLSFSSSLLSDPFMWFFPFVLVRVTELKKVF